MILGNLQAVVPQHSAGCGGEAEGRVKAEEGWDGLGAWVGHPGAGAITVFFLGLPGSHPWTMAPLQVRLLAAQGASLGTTSLGPMAELYGAANQDSGLAVTSALPAPPQHWLRGHSLGVSGPQTWRPQKLKEGETLSVFRGRGRREARDNGWETWDQ